MPSHSICISIIVPVYNNPQQLGECLTALIAQPCPGQEIIVVDDASTDETPAVAASMGVRVLRLAKNSGHGVARNYGACHARGDILLFLDSDVVVASGVVQQVIDVFEVHSDVAAVFGSYDTQPHAPGVISQYRNLLHHFVHQHGNSEASTFWTGCGAIRRQVFEAMGGFDARFSHSIPDIELGYRLRRAGYRILLDKAMQVTHLKRWTLRSVIRTDITRRAIPWTRLILEYRNAPNDLNLKREQRWSVGLVMLACLLLVLGVFWMESLALSAAAFLGVGVLNRELYSFFARQRGLRFAAACLPLHLLYYVYSGLSYLYVWIGFQLRVWRRAR